MLLHQGNWFEFSKLIDRSSQPVKTAPFVRAGESVHFYQLCLIQWYVRGGLLSFYIAGTSTTKEWIVKYLRESKWSLNWMFKEQIAEHVNSE